MAAPVWSGDCFAAGTLIATPLGETPAEALRAGDFVLALHDHETLPRAVRWVGRFGVNLARHPARERAAPVRLRAGAVAPGIPARDLLLSPDHAVLLHGCLCPALALCNGATVAVDRELARVTYIQIELARPGILLAEGMPAETWPDAGNRGQFAGERGFRGLYPDLAPRLLPQDAPAAALSHGALLARARALGHRLTGDAALRVLADGAELPLARFGPGHWQARLPGGARAVRLLSRRFVPADLDPASSDRRTLGLAVSALRLAGRAVPGGAYGRGWHAAEPGWRWTDGDARLMLRPRAAAAVLELRAAAAASAGYWLPPPARAAARDDPAP